MGCSIWPSERKQPLWDTGVSYTDTSRGWRTLAREIEDLATFYGTLIYPKVLGATNNFSKFHYAPNRNVSLPLKGERLQKRQGPQRTQWEALSRVQRRTRLQQRQETHDQGKVNAYSSSQGSEAIPGSWQLGLQSRRSWNLGVENSGDQVTTYAYYKIPYPEDCREIKEGRRKERKRP